jgi:peroxiredoxin Q/BCP
MSMKLEIGQKAPDFTLPDQNNKEHKLSNFLGNWVLLYFYPRDNTPGCTKEACGIRDVYKDYKENDVTVLGISTDSVASHKKFEEKHVLPFTLLSDENKKVVALYGAYGEKKMMGKTFMGTKRISFLIDKEGKIAKIYLKVKPADHAQEVISDIISL